MNRPIRTYIAAFKSGISTLMEYRIDFLINSTLSLMIHALVQILLWKSVFTSKGQGAIQGYTADSMYIYICFVSLCTILTRSGRIERGVGDEIRNGDLNKYLLKPLSHLGFSGAMVAAEKVGTLLFALIIFPFLVFFTTYQIHITGTVWGMLILLTAIICKFFISMAISYLAFWYEETWTFHIILDISMVFLSGAMLPLSILPAWILPISNLLPFQYFGYIPGALASGTISISHAPFYLIMSILWCLIFWMITKSIWFLGMRKYGAFGG
jgi:ABC-2 type transport system permease protein